MWIAANERVEGLADDSNKLSQLRTSSLPRSLNSWDKIIRKLSVTKSRGSHDLPGTSSRWNPSAFRALQHARQHPVRRAVAIDEGLDVEDDLLAHIAAALVGGRAHVGQQGDLSRLCQCDQFVGNRRGVLEHIETSPGDFVCLQHSGQSI